MTTNVKPIYWDLLDRYSSLDRLLRVTTICRVASRCRKVENITLSTPLTPLELQQSAHFCVKVVQGICIWFRTEINILSNGEYLSRSNPLIRLTQFLDRQGLLRIGGRLQNAKLDPDVKHPMILPKNSPLSALIIANAHQRTLRGGTQITLAFIREKYWILGGRAPVRSYILRCVRCARYRGRRAQQLMGQLPTPRVTPSRPFLHAGIDYVGPITIKTWRGNLRKPTRDI